MSRKESGKSNTVKIFITVGEGEGIWGFAILFPSLLCFRKVLE